MLRNIGARGRRAHDVWVSCRFAAHADLKLCNKTESRVGVALGYKDKQGWVTEGWWTVEPQKCVHASSRAP